MSCPAAKNAWIIGGAGFLGSALAAQCRALGWRVLVVDPACSPGADAVQAEAGEPGGLEQAAAMLLPHVVFFCAATRGGDAAAYRRAGLLPVLRVTELVPHAHPVFCSSCAVYSGSGLVQEQSPTPGDTERQQVLLAAEAAVLRSGGAVARLAALYGPGRCELLRRHLAGEPQLPGAPERVLNYVHVQDAARALILLAGDAGVYNVCAESFTKAEAYALLEELTGVPRCPRVAQAGRRGVADHRVCAGHLRKALAWVPQMHFFNFVKENMAPPCCGGAGVL